jgi:Domain of unknown function (DUF4440)
MRRPRVVAVLAVVSVLSASGETRPAAMPEQAGSQPGDEQAVVRLNRELMEAPVSGNWALLERTKLDTYVFIGPFGNIEEGAQSIPSPDMKIESIETDQVRVRLYGDTAILTQRNTVKAWSGGRNVSGQYRGLRVFIRRDGQWRLAAVSAVPVAATK